MVKAENAEMRKEARKRPNSKLEQIEKQENGRMVYYSTVIIPEHTQMSREKWRGTQGVFQRNDLSTAEESVWRAAGAPVFEDYGPSPNGLG